MLEQDKWATSMKWRKGNLKKFKKILGMALAVSLVITQFPAGKAAKAASGEAVELHYGQKAVVVEEQTAKIDIDTLEVKLSCNNVAEGIAKTDGSGNEWPCFSHYITISFDVTVGEEKKTIDVTGAEGDYSQTDKTFSLEGLGIKKGQSFKIEAVTWQYASVGSEPWLFKLSIAVPTVETTVSDAVELHYGQKAVVLAEQTAKVDIDALEVKLSCHQGALDILKPVENGSTQEWVNFSHYITISFEVTVAGETKKIDKKGQTEDYSQTDKTFSLEGLGIKKGQNFKIEAVTWAYETVGSEPWLYKVSFVIPTSSDDSETTPTPSGKPSTSPSDEPSTPPSDEPSTTPSDEPSTPPSGDDDTSKIGEVQTSGGAAEKKLATVIPETTADDNYNTAAVSVQCASDVNFNEWCNLNLVVTVNGKATTITQKGDSWTTGGTSTYDIKNEFAIKKGDTYKIEAYTDSWDKHTDSWVFKVGVTLGYEASDVNLEQGKLYCGKKADVLETSDVTADCNSLAFEVKCAADTSFNPWTSIEFTVIINSTAYTYTVKGTDESYANGSTQSCTLDGLGIKAGDCVRIQAITYSWDSASDYVFKLTAKPAEGTFTPSDSEMEAVPIVEPSKTTPNPTAKPSAEPTVTPSTEPTDAPSEPTIAPSTEPTDAPSEPTVAPSTEPTKAPSLKKGDKVTKAGNTYEVANASAKTVKYVKAENTKKSTVTVPSTVKITVNGKSVTCKVVGIADNAFKNNKNLKEVTIGSNIKSIGKNAFSGCSKLRTIIIKSTSITKIGKNAFKGVPKTTVIKVPKNKVKEYQKALKKAGFKGKVKAI